LFARHDSVKKRALECFLETAKIALKGRNKKFQYILSTGASKVCDIEGDEFAESDYGLVLDNSNESQKLEDSLTQLAHAALQNQTISMASIVRILNSPSMSEVKRIIEKDEKDIQDRKSKEFQSTQKLQQDQMQYVKDVEQQKIQLQDTLNQRDNETKILIAEMNAGQNVEETEDTTREELNLKIRKLDEEMTLKNAQHSHQVNQDNVQNQLKEKDLEIKKIQKSKPVNK